MGMYITNPIDWNYKNSIIADMIGEALDIQFVRIVREKMGDVYSPMVNMGASKLPRPELTLFILLGCDPVKTDKLADASLKILNDFDGLGAPKDAQVLGETGTFEIIRSVPGELLASGAVAVGTPDRGDCPGTFVAQGLDAFFAQSLQRRVRTAVAATAGDDGAPVYARGALVECPPDGDAAAFKAVAARRSAPDRCRRKKRNFRPKSGNR